MTYLKELNRSKMDTTTATEKDSPRVQETAEFADESHEKAAIEEAVVISHLAESAQPKLWTRRMFRLYGILLLGYLCIVLQGYDGSLMGAINAMVRAGFRGEAPRIACMVG